MITKQKFLLRLQDDVKAKDGNVTSISLPRMAFELTGFEYDASRQQNKLIRTQKTVLETSGKIEKYLKLCKHSRHF